MSAFSHAYLPGALGSLEWIFNGLLTASWQASVLAALVLSLQLTLRGRLNPRWRYALWLLVLGRLLLPIQPESALSLFQFAPTPPAVFVQPITAPFFAPATFPEASLTLTAAPAEEEIIFSPYSVIALIWLGGVVLLFVLTWRINRRFLRQMARSPEIVDSHLLALFATTKNELHLRRNIRLVESANVQSPAIMGLFRPTLILPAQVRDKFDPTELRLIFLHELAHLKRGDVIVQALIALLQIVHWFNPALWFAFRRMRADREPATDALVLSRAGETEKERYGLMLLKLLEHFNQRHSLPTLVGILEDKDQFKRRFTLIAKFTRGAYGWSVLGVVLICVLVISGFTKSKARVTNSPVISLTDQKKIIQAIRKDDFEASDRGANPIASTPSIVEHRDSSSKTSDNVAAVVNRKSITWTDVYHADPSWCNMLSGVSVGIDKPSEQQILQSLIDRELMVETFHEEGRILPTSFVDDEIADEVRARYGGNKSLLVEALQKGGYSMEEYRANCAETAIVGYEREKNVDRAVESYYQKNLELFLSGDKISVSLIRVFDRTGKGPEGKLIQELLAKTRAGADFEALAKKYHNTDDEFVGPYWLSNEDNGFSGIPGWLPTTWSKLSAMKRGQITEVMTVNAVRPQGARIYYIVRVNDRISATSHSSEEEKKEKELLQDEKLRLTETWLKNMRARATIQLFATAATTTTVSKSPIGTSIPLLNVNGLVTKPEPALESKPQIEIHLAVAEIDVDMYEANHEEVDAAVDQADVGYFNRKGVSSCALPSVTVPSGLKSNMDILRQFPFPISFDLGQISANPSSKLGVTIVPPQEFVTKDIGVSAEITPSIDYGHDSTREKILFNGKLTVTSLAGYTKSNLSNVGLPSFDTSESHFSEAMEDGQEKALWIPGVHILQPDGGAVANPNVSRKTHKARFILFLQAKLVR